MSGRSTITDFEEIVQMDVFGDWLDTMINFIDDILNLASPELPLFAGLLLLLRHFCSVLINSG